MCLYSLYVQSGLRSLSRPETVLYPLDLEFQMAVSHHMGPLQEKKVLLTTEPLRWVFF